MICTYSVKVKTRDPRAISVIDTLYNNTETAYKYGVLRTIPIYPYGNITNMLTSISQLESLAVDISTRKLQYIYGRLSLCHKVVSYYVFPFVVTSFYKSSMPFDQHYSNPLFMTCSKRTTTYTIPFQPLTMI